MKLIKYAEGVAGGNDEQGLCLCEQGPKRVSDKPFPFDFSFVSETPDQYNN